MADNRLHHSQMLQVVVRLEQGISREELHKDAPYAPDVTGVGPAQPDDDFGCPVMAGRYNRGVVFILERGRAKVDEADLRVE